MNAAAHRREVKRACLGCIHAAHLVAPRNNIMKPAKSNEKLRSTSTGPIAQEELAHIGKATLPDADPTRT